MKIGLLTYHAVANFGAQLQTFSTVSYLRNNGYDPVIINWFPEDLENFYKKIIPQKQLNEHSKFILENMPITQLCRTEADVISVIEEENIEGVIIGSDAILNYQTFRSRINLTKKGLKLDKKESNRAYPNPFWGSFATKLNKKIPIVMMSASAQNSSYTQIHNSLRKKMQESLLNFDFITVRDKWAQNMVKYLTQGKRIPMITPDPVFGFNYNAEKAIPTKEEILSKFNLPEKYILLSFNENGGYSVSEDWFDTFEQLANKAGYSAVALCMQSGIKFKNNLKYKIDIPLAPFDWYALIKYSQGYIGHKMHPIVISLHNANPFFSFDNFGIVRFKYFVNYKSSKIFHILNEAGLLKNRCTALGRFSYKEPAPPEMVLDCILNFDKKSVKNSRIDI